MVQFVVPTIKTDMAMRHGSKPMFLFKSTMKKSTYYVRKNDQNDFDVHQKMFGDFDLYSPYR